MEAIKMSDRRLFSYLPFILCLAWLAPNAAAGPPREAQPIFKVDEVSVGMKGYGMTVFHGTEIEPFAVEIVTINANETPNSAVIWARCTDERMINTGPVQGMSGSPVYLWEEGEEQVPGKGGRLIGAFAFGYANTNECVIGIQPIEYMRAVGQRATMDDRPQLTRALPPGAGLALMTQLHETSKTLDVPELTRARLGVVREMYESFTPKQASKPQAERRMLTPPDRDVTGDALRMMVPMAVGSKGIADALGPSLRPLGIQPFAVDQGAMGGKPPKGFDVENVELEPGSALVVPFAWGDADLSGAGTVTDVLPDGTVLGFGHAMDGIGATAMPMATGYVHFIVSLNTISYKRTGALEMQGALVQDEQAAVAGVAERPFTSAPVNVKINIEGQPKYEYNYEVLNHPMMGPQIAAAVVAQSAVAVQGAPTRNTVRYSAKAKFSSGHEIEMESAAIGAGGQAAAMEVAQLVGMITQNPFEEVELESLEATVNIEYGFDAYQLMSAKLNKTTAAPGETVKVTVELLDLHKELIEKIYEITVPEDAPDGDTQVLITDAAQYTQMMLVGKPYLNQIDSVDDFVRGLNEVLKPQPTKLYTLMQTKRGGLALDGQGLDNLPASKAVVLGNNNPKSLFYQQMDTTETAFDRIIIGGSQLQLKIKRERGTR
ncbi:MAG: SpoIVB peptidase S55 domain-containing protein [Planctomycetota bacterium]